MKLNVGFVGVGGIASEHLKILNEMNDVKIAAVCDIVKEKAEQTGAQYGAAAYTDVDAMLESESLDALFLCVPPFAHGNIEEKAAARGIHLLVEKPVGLDLGAVRKKAEVLRDSGIIVSTGYCLRYAETVQLAKQYIEGREIAMVRAHRFGGFVEVPWWRDINKSGGQLVEMTTHNLDLIRYFAGDMTKISADMALLMHKDVSDISIPDVTSVNFVLASGAIGHLDTGFIPQPDGRSSLEIMGRNFRLTFEWMSLTIMEEGNQTTYKNEGNFYKAQDEAFLEAIRTGNRSLILAPYDEAVKTLEATLAANESAKTGNSVFLTV